MCISRMKYFVFVVDNIINVFNCLQQLFTPFPFVLCLISSFKFLPSSHSLYHKFEQNMIYRSINYIVNIHKGYNQGSKLGLTSIINQYKIVRYLPLPYLSSCLSFLTVKQRSSAVLIVANKLAVPIPTSLHCKLGLTSIINLPVSTVRSRCTFPHFNSYPTK